MHPGLYQWNMPQMQHQFQPHGNKNHQPSRTFPRPMRPLINHTTTFVQRPTILNTNCQQQQQQGREVNNENVSWNQFMSKLTVK